MAKVKVGIIGTGQRATAFARGLTHELVTKEDKAEITALCDIDEKRLNYFAEKNDLQNVKLTSSIEEFLAGDLVDAVIITVPDRHHREVAEKCFAAGKHCMLEKPMALTVEDCKAIIRAKEAAGKVLQVGFVLRSTPFYKRIKEIVDSGILGQIMSIRANEFLRVGHSISYMRRWHRKKENSGSFLLAKCSHDMDILSWVAGSKAKAVAAFGDNNYFLPSKQPATHCSVCPEADTCPYKFGRQDDGFVVLNEEEKANLSKYDIDLCVYNDDKDVVDNQVAIIEFENNIRAEFSLQCFFPYPSQRSISINGSNGYLVGTCDENKIEVHNALTREKTVHDISYQASAGGGHGGGDIPFILEYIDAIINETEPVADLRAGLASTVLAISIDEAMLQRKVVEIPASEYEV
ncbi:MAG: Gfo/Idh/MocA family protein [Planctomycetota bacterium]|jgi:predicted dehydrogenase